MLINEIEKLRTNRASQKRTLANFILQNKQDVYRMTLDELSAQSTVSVSTILRTVHSLGFQSYGDFREAFYDSLRVLNKTDEWLSWCEHLKPLELIEKMIEGEHLKAARYLRNKGCFIVCIGHSDDSVFSEIADIFLEIYLNYYGFTTGYSSIMTALNFMVLRYCQRNAENVKRCIENFETVMSENDVFVTK